MGARAPSRRASSRFDAPDGLADELAAARIVVTAGGVTMLEACLLGRPVVALALADNQRQAVSGLEREGAVMVATPETVVGGRAHLMVDPRPAGYVVGDGPFRDRRQGRGARRRHARATGVVRRRGRSSLCVVQARTGSTRLPGKVLQELGGRPLLRFMLDRLADLRVDELVVATSTLDRDDAVVDIARDAGRPVVRGSESDVLDRFAARSSRTPPITSCGSRPTARSPTRC